MVWIPVYEAAASLGVSERTIWRRIKSSDIESKSESGRTFVAMDDPPEGQETMRQLSHVAAAQLSMRKLDADKLSETLNVLSKYRTSIENEVVRSRRMARWSFAVCMAMLAVVMAGGWYHINRVATLAGNQEKALTDLRDGHQIELLDIKQTVARHTALAEARGDENENLRKTGEDQRRRLATAEKDGRAYQKQIDEHLAGFLRSTTADRAQLAARDDEASGLRKSVEQLRDELAQKDRIHSAVQLQTERVKGAVQRSAWRNKGLAQGLQLHIAYLNDEHGMPPSSPQHDFKKQMVWESVLADGASTRSNKAYAPGGWTHMGKWFVWNLLFGPEPETQTTTVARAQ